MLLGNAAQYSFANLLDCVLLWFTSIKNGLAIFTYSSLISQATTSPFLGIARARLKALYPVYIPKTDAKCVLQVRGKM